MTKGTKIPVHTTLEVEATNLAKMLVGCLVAIEYRAGAGKQPDYGLVMQSSTEDCLKVYNPATSKTISVIPSLGKIGTIQVVDS